MNSFNTGQVLAYHEAIRDEVRSDNLDTFLRPIRRSSRSGAAGSSKDASSGEAAVEGLPIVMVATDRMSRGEYWGKCLRICLVYFTFILSTFQSSVYTSTDFVDD